MIMPHDIFIYYLPRTYATEYIIEDTDTDINQSKQGDLKSLPDNSQDLCTKPLICETVFSEDRLKVIFVEVLYGPILQSISG